MKVSGVVTPPFDFEEKWPQWVLREDNLPWYRLKTGYYSRGMWIVCDRCGQLAPSHHYHSGRFCSQPCAYPSRGQQNHHNWRGGRHPDKDGYIRVTTEEGRRPEHCVVMEAKLGRKLYPHEKVHHKNGVKDDNRSDNLELWVKAHPPGQRVDDLLDWVAQFYPSELRERLG